MSKIGAALRGILVWSYERGTIQYDIICALILAFVFFMPRSCFLPKKQSAVEPGNRAVRSAPAGHIHQPSIPAIPR